ncbi:AMP-binding protein [Nocardia cerradoensis]|uniref:AMP-binding protein n=1 Tax=Nocardia cerradoensis TaxID=85688 RepID=UPI003F6BC63E
MRMAVSGAAPLDRELGSAVAHRLGTTVMQGFGMTELSPVSHAVPSDPGLSIAGRAADISSSGWPIVLSSRIRSHRTQGPLRRVRGRDTRVHGEKGPPKELRQRVVRS